MKYVNAYKLKVKNAKPIIAERGVNAEPPQDQYFKGHLTIEENLLTGAFTRRDGNAAIRRDIELVYAYFPKLKERRDAMAGYTVSRRAANVRARPRVDVAAEDDLAG